MGGGLPLSILLSEIKKNKKKSLKVVSDEKN